MIHAEKLIKYYNDLCAVDNINFDVRKGEIVGLLGPNGAGKSTTLRMLTGYIRPTSGTIMVKDYDINDNPLEIKRMLGYLPESAPLYHDMLVYDFLNYVADIRELGSDKKSARIKELAYLCGISEVMHQAIGELSKGYKQRVGLAHAMMNDPEILVLDEPTSGLDPNQIIEIRDIIREIGKEKTVILSTHILSEAEATCDRMMIINNGKIVADDSTSALKESAGGESILKITLKNTDFTAAKESFEGLDSVTEISGDITTEGYVRMSLKSRSDIDVREQIYNHIKQTDWVLLELFQETRTLENVFRELTKEC